MTAGGNTPPGSVVDIPAPAESVDLDLAAAVDAGARGVRFPHPVALVDEEPLGTLGALRVLREAEALGVPVRWRGTIGAGIDAASLVHLPPPECSNDEATDAIADEWRRQHRPGLCYYRIGPDFVFIKDIRVPSTGARFRLDGVVARFRALESVVDVADLDADTAGLLVDLEAEQLVLRLGPYATLLPNRMRRWPVPALDI